MELTFLSNKELKPLTSSKEDINYSTIKFTQIHGVSIDKEGIKDKITASKALKFKTHDELFDVTTTFQRNNKTHTIKADKAHFKEPLLKLSNHVRYEDNLSMKIKSEELEYNVHTKVVKSNSPFTLTSQKGIMKGDTFTYNMADGKLQGTKMHYNFEAKQ